MDQLRPRSGQHHKHASSRARRNRALWAIALILVIALVVVFVNGGRGHHRRPTVANRPPSTLNLPTTSPVPTTAAWKGGQLAPDWKGDGQPVTIAFGGDVSFPPGSSLSGRLRGDPATALGPTVPALLSGADLKMVNFESALTDGTCPSPQPKQFVFYAPPTALTALQAAGVTVATEANNHGEDCGAAGLQMALATKASSALSILGIGNDVQQAFTPYETTIHGQRIAFIAATQVIDADLETAWTAAATHAGLASAYDVQALISAVQVARAQADTVVVYLHWGTETQTCPNALQEPLAALLVKAGADVVVGTHAHVLLGAGYLGTAYVDYGLGNLAFYDNSPPENASGTLLVTVTGRHIDNVTWRPAVISGSLPQPLTGVAAQTALAHWEASRSCTDATAAPGPPLATAASETTPPSPRRRPGLPTRSGRQPAWSTPR